MPDVKGSSSTSAFHNAQLPEQVVNVRQQTTSSSRRPTEERFRGGASPSKVHGKSHLIDFEKNLFISGAAPNSPSNFLELKPDTNKGKSNLVMPTPELSPHQSQLNKSPEELPSSQALEWAKEFMTSTSRASELPFEADRSVYTGSSKFHPHKVTRLRYMEPTSNLVEVYKYTQRRLEELGIEATDSNIHKRMRAFSDICEVFIDLKITDDMLCNDVKEDMFFCSFDIFNLKRTRSSSKITRGSDAKYDAFSTEMSFLSCLFSSTLRPNVNSEPVLNLKLGKLVADYYCIDNCEDVEKIATFFNITVSKYTSLIAQGWPLYAALDFIRDRDSRLQLPLKYRAKL